MREKNKKGKEKRMKITLKKNREKGLEMHLFVLQTKKMDGKSEWNERKQGSSKTDPSIIPGLISHQWFHIENTN